MAFNSDTSYLFYNTISELSQTVSLVYNFQNCAWEIFFLFIFSPFNMVQFSNLNYASDM